MGRMSDWRTDNGTQGDLPPWVRYVLGDDSPSRSPDDPPPELPPVEPPPDPQPGARPGHRWWLVAAIVGLLALVAVPLVITGSGSDEPATTASPPPPAWAVDVCVRLVHSPGPYPSGLDYQGRLLWDRQRQYSTVACTDPSAEGRVTAKGVQYSRGDVITRRSIESGCPDDTDFEMHVPDQFDLGHQTWCVRNLRPPHVADPGEGGGRMIAGDCVMVTTSDYARRNDRIRELPCTEPYFAKVLAAAPNAAGCPTGTLSRLPNPTAQGSALCLGQGENAMIVRAGECISWPSNMFEVVRRVPCTGRLVYHVVSFADREKDCRRPLSPFTINGYDRIVCLRSPQG
jgi:hypothetical protein